MGTHKLLNSSPNEEEFQKYLGQEQHQQNKCGIPGYQSEEGTVHFNQNILECM